MTHPLVTVVIPVYNYADKVGRAIESVRAQTLSNFELFVVDDGSTDSSKEAILAALGDDSRCHYIYHENHGVAFSRNRGISFGTAPFVCCLDADDAIEPQFLEVCVDTLVKDRATGIAYTGLRYIMPDGKTGVSKWPGEFNYQKQLDGINQVPTCCVFRRVIWERLGGYRGRYCPRGQGAEDAEFWLRAGAYGFDAQLATPAPMFIYSYMSGRASGDPEYAEVDWRAFHPWAYDDSLHPFPSVAKPANNRPSHAVRQYDTPTVSVIIPVGAQHKSTVFYALDSLESQTYPNWEAIVVDDTGQPEGWTVDGFPDAWRAYPYAKVIPTNGKRGAGHARNVGVQYARAPFLLFLDADDLLYPEAIEEMLNAWQATNTIIYSDYAGKVKMSSREDALSFGDQLAYYDSYTGDTIVLFKASEYDCERAQRQPDRDMYIWNLITSLVPRVWHEEIGGFDEDMDSWEDWDYWIRMARADKCFTLIRKPLVLYKFYTGTRRELGLQSAQSLIKYLQEKYKRT